MTAFNPGEENNSRLDWKILRDGSVALYRNDDFLEEDVDWLRSKGYKIVLFDCMIGIPRFKCTIHSKTPYRFPHITVETSTP
jgi:hypothetical protein